MKVRQKMQLRQGYTLGGRLDRTLKEKVVPTFSPTQETDFYWMEQAILTAMNGVGWSAPNPSVGAVIVNSKTNQELSRGFTQAFRREHAERMAIESAQKAQLPLWDATLYVTLEPCAHFGSQPPCADLVVASGVRRVVIGTLDPDSRVLGRGIEKLRSAGIDVTKNVLEAECQAWHFPFIRTRDPAKKIVWVAKWAQTPDGALANSNGDSKWISSPNSRAYTHWLRQRYDAILVGVETYLKDQPQLNVRDCAPPHRRNPIRFVLDRKGRLSGQNLDSKIRVVRSIQEVEKLELDPPLQSVLVEGGPTLLNALIQDDVFDAVHQFIGPKNFTPPTGADPLRYRVNWAPSSSWYCAAQQKIDTDDLREWVKSF